MIGIERVLNASLIVKEPEGRFRPPAAPDPALPARQSDAAAKQGGQRPHFNAHTC